MILSDEALLCEISALEDRRYDAMVRADGKRQDGAAFLRGLAAGDDVYHTIAHGIDRIVRLANSLLAYGWQKMNVETGGAMRELDNLSLVVLSQAGEGWKLAAYVSTPRGHAPAPARER